MTQSEIEKATEYSRTIDGNLWDAVSGLQMDGHVAHGNEHFNAVLEELRSWVDLALLAGAEHAGAKWIKCSERYPDNSSAVLVYVRDGTIYDHCAMYCQAVDYYQFNGQWSHCTDVTHWRPLPLSPEAESK